MTDHDTGDLADRVAGALWHPDARRLLGDLEESHPHHLLVAATRAAASRPVWDTGIEGSLGLVTGSGGTQVRLPHVSTMAAFVASCVPGVRVVKAGSANSRCKDEGSARCARALGMPVARDPRHLTAALDAHDFAVVDTRHVYPWLYTPGLLTFPFVVEAISSVDFTPCPVTWKVNGITDTDPDRHRHRYTGTRDVRVMLVQGRTDRPGVVLDEATTTGTTVLITIGSGTHMRTHVVEPEQVGLTRRSLEDLVVAPRQDTVDNARTVLAGTATRAHTDLVALNAAVILVHAGAVPDLSTGCARAADLLATGVPARRLAGMRAP
ncbi:MAG: anthranilate phosphoribosyltransferase [Actinomycetota bacterium]|nr:anthranilate phosphoribosyltransferase [Actinomycetota bacterium]